MASPKARALKALYQRGKKPSPVNSAVSTPMTRKTKRTKKRASKGRRN